MRKLAVVAVLMLLGATAAAARIPSSKPLVGGGDGTAAGRIVQLILVITVLSVAPGLLVMVTCFTRFVVALSFLRAGPSGCRPHPPT
jgi:flagellar biosynthetic protein FliP